MKKINSRFIAQALNKTKLRHKYCHQVIWKWTPDVLLLAYLHITSAVRRRHYPHPKYETKAVKCCPCTYEASAVTLCIIPNYCLQDVCTSPEAYIAHNEDRILRHKAYTFSCIPGDVFNTWALWGPPATPVVTSPCMATNPAKCCAPPSLVHNSFPPLHPPEGWFCSQAYQSDSRRRLDVDCNRSGHKALKTTSRQEREMMVQLCSNTQSFPLN